MPEHAVPASPGRRDDRAATTAVGQGGVRAGPIADREAREGQLPKREVPPGAAVPLELDRSAWHSPARRRRPCAPCRLGASPARPRTTRCRRAAGPRTFRARRHPRNACVAATSPAAISSQAASTASHGRASRASTPKTPGPGSDRRSMAGPVILDEAVADQRGDEVGVARREGVIDGALDGVVRLIPRRGSAMEGRPPARARAPRARAAGSRAGACGSGMTRRSRPSAASSVQGRCRTSVDPCRSATASHSGAGSSLEDRRARQERDLGRGAALEHLGPQVVVDEVVACRRRSDRIAARTSGAAASRAPAAPATLRSLASGASPFRPAAAARARVPARRPRARPSPAPRVRSRAASRRRASGRTGGASARVPRWPPATLGQMLDQLREDVEARPRGDPVPVVDGDPDGLVAVGTSPPAIDRPRSGATPWSRRDRR